VLYRESGATLEKLSLRGGRTRRPISITLGGAERSFHKVPGTKTRYESQLIIAETGWKLFDKDRMWSGNKGALQMLKRGLSEKGLLKSSTGET